MEIKLYNETISIPKLRTIELSDNAPYQLKLPLLAAKKFAMENEGYLVKIQIEQDALGIKLLQDVSKESIDNVPLKLIEYEQRVIGINLGSFSDHDYFYGFVFSNQHKIDRFYMKMIKAFPVNRGICIGLYNNELIRDYKASSLVMMMSKGIEFYMDREKGYPEMSPFDRFLIKSMNKQIKP